ncbi:MAG: phosphodiester glycosidase family protein [Clostridia bacterium]|nr:phosphodiester glycosidase family protein [Clostridia bacterium]
MNMKDYNIINFGKLTVVLLIITVITTASFAAAFGSRMQTAVSVETAEGTTYVSNVFISDNSGVGRQSENYYVYRPNPGIVPVVVNDSYVYGRTKVSDMANKLKEQGMNPVMVMNSDFFSLDTGIQIGHQVIDGAVVTKDTTTQEAVGFREDGTAFMSALSISTTVTVGEHKFAVQCINKLPQPYDSIYMQTDSFSDTTKSQNPSYNVIIGGLSGPLMLNGKVTGVVEEVTESEGEINIPKDKIVMTVDTTVSVNQLANLRRLGVGTQVVIENTPEGDNRWGECKYIQSSVGGRLIRDGEIISDEKGAAPRSAIGITKDGSIIFYTIDGRQSGYSYGMSLGELSARLAQLGCVDAINMDGGGSTCIVGVYPGSSDITILNKPSDGSERAVATFVALLNTRGASGVAAKLHVSPFEGSYLSGATEKFSAKATDTNDHPVAIDGELTYSADWASYIAADGTATLQGNGSVTIKAEGGNVRGSSTVNVYATPDAIRLYDSAASKEIKSLDIAGGSSLQLTAEAIVGGQTLVSDNSCYEWRVEGPVGSIDRNGLFTASMVSSTGSIVVRAGNCTSVLPITVKGDEYAAYTRAEFSHNNSYIEIKLNSPEGINVEKENISVTIDGEPTDFEYDGTTVTAEKSGREQAKVMVDVTNSLGMRTIKAYTAGGTAYTNNFSDTDSHWGRDTIAYMSSRNVIRGVQNADGTCSFYPKNNMTRAEFAVMTANFMNIEVGSYNAVQLPFEDVQQIPDWAMPQIRALYSMGIMNGKTASDGVVSFDSTACVTRAEAAAVLSRVFGETLKTQPMNYTDFAQVPDYASAAFETLVSVGAVAGYDDGRLMPDKNVTRAEAVRMIYGIY